MKRFDESMTTSLGADSRRVSEGFEQTPRRGVGARQKLRMPLHAENEIGVLERNRFDDVVVGSSFDSQSSSERLDRLSVHGVHADALGVEDFSQESVLGDVDVVLEGEADLGIVGVASSAVIHALREGFDRGAKRSSEGDVEVLHAATDCERRHASGERRPDERERGGVASLVVGFGGGRGKIAVARGMHIAPRSGEHEAVAMRESRLGDGVVVEQRHDHRIASRRLPRRANVLIQTPRAVESVALKGVGDDGD